MSHAVHHEIIHAFQQKRFAVFMGEFQHAFGGFVKTGDAIKYSSFAGTIGADQSGDLLAGDIKRQITNGRQTAEAHGEVHNLKLRVAFPNTHNQPCPSATRSPEMAFFSFK